MTEFFPSMAPNEEISLHTGEVCRSRSFSATNHKAGLLAGFSGWAENRWVGSPEQGWVISTKPRGIRNPPETLEYHL